jgi:two-component system cell cycle response regulator
MAPVHAGPTILLVDGQRALIESLGRRLEQQGYHTLCARTGAAAVELAQNTLPQVILLDVQLPDMDALAVCDQLASHPATHHIPVIILSNMARPDIIRRSRVAMCQYFVRKPFDAKALCFLIQHAIEETAQSTV